MGVGGLGAVWECMLGWGWDGIWRCDEPKRKTSFNVRVCWSVCENPGPGHRVKGISHPVFALAWSSYHFTDTVQIQKESLGKAFEREKKGVGEKESKRMKARKESHVLPEDSGDLSVLSLHFFFLLLLTSLQFKHPDTWALPTHQTIAER